MTGLVSIAACLLLGQADPHATAASPLENPPHAEARPAAGAPASPAAAPATTSAGTTSAAAPDDWTASVNESTELAAELFQPTAASDSSVKAVKLTDVVSATRGAPERAAAVRVYWQLSAAAAKLSATQRELEKLERLADLAGRRPDAQAATALAAAISKATQERNNADDDLSAARRDVSRRMNLDGRTTPVAIDVPHAGTYHTRFDNIYASTAPPQAVVLHRTIQLRGQTVFAHAAAARASSRLADADLAAFVEGKISWNVALASVVEQGRRRRAFIDAVYAYNRDIAEYALPIAKSDASTAVLVGMLIKTEATSTPTVRTPSSSKSASRPAGNPSAEAHSSASGPRR